MLQILKRVEVAFINLTPCGGDMGLLRLLTYDFAIFNKKR
jgi:hypothetical protein